MSIERLGEEDWEFNKGHIYRYNLVKKYLTNSCKILDVACGIGYGAKILCEESSVNIEYVGVDKTKPSNNFLKYGKFIYEIDLNNWTSDFSWDIGVCFETLEHLENPKNLVEELKKSKKLIFVSVPTRPSKHFNSFHLHDFTVNDILKFFYGLKLIYIEDQKEELSHIFVFEK